MYSLGLLKPDCLSRNLESDVMAFIENKGLEIVQVKKMRLSWQQVMALYGRCQVADYFLGLAEFMMSGPVIVYIVKGNSAIEKLNRIVGTTDPVRADKDTIRGKFGMDIRHNISHSSSDYESFRKEAKALFGENVHNLFTERW